MLVAFCGAAIAMLLASVIGVTSGWFFGTRVDATIQRVVDAGMSFPPLIILIVVASLVGGSLTLLIVTLGVITSIGASRVVRSATIAVRSEPYFEAARVMGAKPGRTILVHILPNIFPTLIVIGSVNLGSIVLAEASLSFLGLGISDPTKPTWGRMLFDSRRTLQVAPLLAVWPGVMISFTVFGFNMLGDALRDVLDPRLRGTEPSARTRRC